MFVLSLTTAGSSLVVVNHLDSSFRSAASEVERETAMVAQVREAFAAEDGASHRLVDLGSSQSPAVVGTDQEVNALLVEAASVYNDPAELSIVAWLQTRHVTMYAEFLALAADPAAADRFGAELADKNGFHFQIVTQSDETFAQLAELDRVSRQAVDRQVQKANRSERRLVAVLALLFGFSTAATVVFARRMSRHVLTPIQHLTDSADRFGNGELDHRIDLPQTDELGELAARFNAMASAVAANQQQLAVQAHHDTLTGLLNRAGFLERLTEAMSHHDVADGVVSVMFIDLDDFKHVNDGLGHAAGDEVLRPVATVLMNATRPKDLVARLGGDEFALLLSSGSDQLTAEDVAQRVLDALAAPLTIQGHAVTVGASIGVTSRDDPDEGIDELLRQADMAMYTAKGRGKNCWETFDAQIHGQLLDRRTTTTP
jgi:diguanylate cyclase (GGDEF)-like protein